MAWTLSKAPFSAASTSLVVSGGSNPIDFRLAPNCTRHGEDWVPDAKAAAALSLHNSRFARAFLRHQGARMRQLKRRGGLLPVVRTTGTATYATGCRRCR